MYPTVEELHIALDQSIQYINSNREQGLEIEEKDMLLNAAVMEFISTRSNPKTNYRREGYEESVKRTDDLRELKVTTPVALRTYNYDSSTVFTILPHDYLHHISSSSEVYYNCKTLSYTNNNFTDKYVVLDFPKDSAVGTKYASFKIEVTYATPTTATIYTLHSALTSFTNGDSKFEIINHVLEEVNKSSDYRIYWENYDNIYIKNSFIIISIGAKVLLSGKLSYTGYTAHTATAISSRVLTYNTTSGSTSYKPNDIVSSLVNDTMFENYYFNKNRHLRPIAWIEDSRLYIHTDSNYKIVNQMLTYIKKPRLINYKLGQTCELSFNNEIINIATRMYKAKIDSQNLTPIINEQLKQE